MKKTKKPGRPINPESLRQSGESRYRHPRVAFHWPVSLRAEVQTVADARHGGELSAAIRELLSLGLSVKTRQK